MACGVVFFVVLAFLPAGIFANKVEDDEETCRRYANGQVYPEKTTISEHAVHWSKAQSKSQITMSRFHRSVIINSMCLHGL